MSADEQPQQPSFIPDFEGEIPPHVERLSARSTALDILSDVLDRKQALDHVLERSEDLRSLTGRDRAFIRMTVATALRRLGQIDDLILRATDKGEAPRPPMLFNLLRLAVAQMFFMAVPDYAVVDSAVRLAESKGMGKSKGFVNAVLRRLTREGKEWLAKQDESRLNISEWLMKIWITDYGLRGAAEIALACLAEAPLDISIKNPGMAEHWAQTLDARILPTGTLRRISGGAVQDLPGFEDGMWWVQDAAAAIPAQLFGDVTDRSVLDLCAAPGGKTAQLAAKGAHVIALDRSMGRLKRLEENLKRLRLEDHVTIEAADAAVWQPKEPVPYILLDAPCSATGTVRRHPDVLHLKSERDVRQLAEVQARILDNAANMLMRGGILVYCTCSLQKAEGEHQIDALLARNPAIRRFPVQAEDIGNMEGLLNEQGDIRILPYHYAPHGGMDGFFISRLTKD